MRALRYVFVITAVLFLAGCSSAPTTPLASPTTLATPTRSSVATTAAATTTTAVAASTTIEPLATAPPTSATPTSTVSPTTVPPGTPYAMPVDSARASYAHEHHDYPASDIFVACAAPVAAPVNATVLEVRRVDAWEADVDNPATRGGKSISLLGDDGVRYYLAHLEVIDEALQPGQHVDLGAPLGQIGKTGRAGACHLHFAISPPCPGKEWSVRRGVIWPWPYLDAWRTGEQRSPAEEINQWLLAHPDACALAMSDPNAPDS